MVHPLAEIRKASLTDIHILEKVIINSFLVPHGHAAPKKDMDSYISNHFTTHALIEDISNPKNQYFVLFYKNEMVGFSKTMFNFSNENIDIVNITKMERIYLLKEFYGLGLGEKLFSFNVNLAKENNQKGIWLHVWVENKRAINFYKKMGMKPVGNYNFKISEKHYNPNYVMYLAF